MAGGVVAVGRGVVIDHHEYAHDRRLPAAFDDGDGWPRLDDSAMKPAVVPADRQSALCRSVGGEFMPDDGQWWAWLEDAACRGVGPAEFFEAQGRGRRRCRVCPAVEACFWWAIVAESDLGYRFGIWGGATPAVRAQVARVTGVAYARARFAAAAGQWQGSSGRPAEKAVAG
jgi:hypothetical protein